MSLSGYKNCCDCGMVLSFEQFRQNHPSLSKARLRSLWEDPLINIYCPACYFNRIERPYKRKRRDFQWYQLKYHH
jgi:hypothetical protein